MTDTYFNQLLELAGEIAALAEAENTLDKRAWKAAKKRHDRLEEQFKEVRKNYVNIMLGTPEGHDQAYDLLAADIAAIRANGDPSWEPAVNYLSDELLPYLRKEAGRDPKVRKAISAAPWILGGIALIAYFAIRFFSATPINHAIETKEGIQERAAAVVKLLRYDDWMDTHVRRGGWLKGILLWPIKPSEAEINGASEFASLAYEAQQASVEQFNCPAIQRGYGDTPSQSELDYLAEAATYLRDPTAEWKEPAVITAVDAARVFGKC